MVQNNTKKKSQADQEEVVLQAAIVADSFNNNFKPISSNCPRSLFPLVNQPAILYTLEFLAASGYEDIYIFCCHKSAEIKKFISECPWSERAFSGKISVISSPDYHSMGDVLRDIDQKSLFQSDFLLLRGDFVSNAVITDAIKEHRERRERDKNGPLMTMLLQKSNRKMRRAVSEDLSVAINSSTNQLLHYEKIKSNKINFPLSILSETSVDIYYNLSDIDACICSPQVPQLFTDNFDYQTIHDFIKGILINEEFYGNQIHVFILENSFSARISTFAAYDVVSRAIVARWAHPLVPENDISYGHKAICSHYSRNVYVGSNVTKGAGSALKSNVVVGSNTTIRNNCCITNCVIGSNCEIGDNVTLAGSYLWDDVCVNDNSTIMNSLVCTKAVVGESCRLNERTVVAQKMSVTDGTATECGDVIANEEPEELSRQQSSSSLARSSVSEVSKAMWELSLSDKSNASDEEVDEFERIEELGDDLSDQSDVDDELTLFYREVKDSLHHGFREKTQTDNLILEINSSKYAYNLSMNDVIVALTKSIIEIADLSTDDEYFPSLKKMISYSTPVFTNYNKSAILQLVCLQTIENNAGNDSRLLKYFAKLLMLLYDEDILAEEVILHWHKLDEGDKNIRQKADKLVEWLENADEED